MAATMRPESLLPTIKCSTCGQDIDIASLADHVCTAVQKPQEHTTKPPSPVQGNNVTDPAIHSDSITPIDPAIQQAPGFLDSKPLHQQSSRFLRPGRNAPPQIDPAAANRPFLQVDQLTPLSDYSNYSDGRSNTPVTPSTQVTTPSSMFSRKVGGAPSRTPSPPSPNLASNLDSAFPPFPARYNESNLRVGASDRMMAPVSPRINGGANVLQRMNTIAPGPFTSQRMKGYETGAKAGQASGMQRDRSNSGASQKQFRNADGREHFRRPSAAESVRSQGSIRSNHSIDRQRPYGGISEDLLSSRPLRRADTVDRFLEQLSSDTEPSPMLGLDFRSKTFPEGTERRPRHDFDPMQPAPSAPPYRSEFYPEPALGEDTRPTTSAGPMGVYGGFSKSADPAVQNPFNANPYSQNGPDQSLVLSTNVGRSRSTTVTQSSPLLEDADSTWFERPRPSPLPPTDRSLKLEKAGNSQSSGEPIAPPVSSSRSRSKTITRPNVPQAVSRPSYLANGAPPVPVMPKIFRQNSDNSSRGDRYHSPSDSGSSYASSNISTAPTSEGSAISRSGSASDNSDAGRRRTMSKEPFARTNMLTPPPVSGAGGFHDAPESPIDPAIQKMKSPVDPAVQNGGFFLGASTSARARLPLGDGSSSARSHAMALPRQTEPRPFRQPAPASKGNCRGCGTPILGKSVKAADGRLTGRYHKECFVCKTCQAPFLTAEFYVLDNAPYCSRHYHELNGSMCRRCDRGIEGQYLETDRREKYHAQCFSCMQCRVRLNEDYFEVEGKAYCERHAFAMARQRGGPGQTFERRHTRLMMM